MSEILTLEIPDELARRARALAAASNRPFEEAVMAWIGRAVEEPPVETLSDPEVLALCEVKLDAASQSELSDLLARLRENELGESQRARLDELLVVYRRGLALTARAIKEAVRRGLKPPLAEDAA